MSYDWDTGKEGRKAIPSYYGFVPGSVKGKVLMFFSLYCLSAFNLLARSLACVIL
jgi:hypothetical protein